MRKSDTLFFVLTIVAALLFFGWGVARTVKAISFDQNCGQYLKRAADANSIEMAKEELGIAISYAEANNLTQGTVSIFLHQPKNDVGYWYRNMKTAYEELENVPEDTSLMEKTNILMKLRETLTDEGENGIEVTIPNGISIYPNNVSYFWWSIISLVAMCIFGVLWLAEEY